MMDQNSVENLKRIAKYLKVSPGTITINDEKVNKFHLVFGAIHFIIQHNLQQDCFFPIKSQFFRSISQVVCRKVKDKTLTGFTTIISAMGRESKSNQFSSSDLLTQTLVVQWFDYAVLFIDPAANSKHLIDLVFQVCVCS